MTDQQMQDLAVELGEQRDSARQRDLVISQLTAAVNALTERVETLEERLSDQEFGRAPDPEIGLP